MQFRRMKSFMPNILVLPISQQELSKILLLLYELSKVVLKDQSFISEIRWLLEGHSLSCFGMFQAQFTCMQTHYLTFLLNVLIQC
mmetsp:Transcript_1449/g.3032  ORF Transcript_1449/g.3032 Transcript_1449/m.3032 type:complete len:85 (-) Transcript_1449:926-1180(-)